MVRADRAGQGLAAVDRGLGGGAARARAAEVTRELDRQWKAAIAEVIAEGVAAGEFSCAEPDAAALRLTALLDGLAVQLTSYTGTVSRARAQEWVDDALARELGLERAALTPTRR